MIKAYGAGEVNGAEDFRNGGLKLMELARSTEQKNSRNGCISVQKVNAKMGLV